MKLSFASEVDEATSASSPSFPRYKMNVAIGAFLGLLAAFGILAFREYTDMTVKTPEDLTDTKKRKKKELFIRIKNKL